MITPIKPTRTEQCYGDKKFLLPWERVWQNPAGDKWAPVVWAIFIDNKDLTLKPKNTVRVSDALLHIKAALASRNLDLLYRIKMAGVYCDMWFDDEITRDPTVRSPMK